MAALSAGHAQRQVCGVIRLRSFLPRRNGLELQGVQFFIAIGGILCNGLLPEGRQSAVDPLQRVARWAFSTERANGFGGIRIVVPEELDNLLAIWPPLRNLRVGLR